MVPMESPAGGGTVVHPRARIEARAGPIIIGARAA